jgi:hypothetical protein
MRQTGAGVCRLRTPIACCAFPKEGSVEQSLRYQARRALLQQVVPQYRESSPSQKRTLLDAFVATTGYHRTYARWLLNHAEEVQQTLQRPRPRQYGPNVQHALFLAWHAANRICAKRLMPFLPTLVEALERHEYRHLTEECRRQLLSMSAATADRLLRSQRNHSQGGLSTCEQEHITFARGRPYQKRDQCNALAEKWSDRSKGAWAMIASPGNTPIGS